MTASQGGFALCPGLFPALSFAQLCQNFVFLDLAILLLSVFDSRFCSPSQLSGSPDLQFVLSETSSFALTLSHTLLIGLFVL